MKDLNDRIRMSLIILVAQYKAEFRRILERERRKKQ